MGDYKAPWRYGPDGPPPTGNHQHGDDAVRTGMGELVLGISVADDNPQLLPAKATLPPPAAERHLFVRERPASQYVPSGPGFYLEGISKEVGAAVPPLVITRGERTAITVSNELSDESACCESLRFAPVSWIPAERRAHHRVSWPEPPGECFR